MLTIKSDDIRGRAATFDAIIKNEPIGEPNVPASFSVMLNYLRGLSLDVELLKPKQVESFEDVENSSL
jgi:DNA-directed RNA polymerase subunit beta